MITTLITTYQRPNLLKRAVESVLNQTFSDFHLCVFDNASQDETEQVMQNLMKQDSRIKYHRHAQNIGMMNNYQFAFSQVNSEYFSILSDDDFLLPNFYKTALEGFKLYPEAAFSCCEVLAINEEKKFLCAPLSHWNKEGFFPVPEGLLEMLGGAARFPLPNGTLFKTSVVKQISPLWSLDMQQRWDTDYFLQLAATFPFVTCKKPVAIFFAHPHSFSERSINSQFAKDNMKTFLAVTNKMMERLLIIPFPKDVKDKIRNLFANLMRIECENFMYRSRSVLTSLSLLCLLKRYARLNKRLWVVFFDIIVKNYFSFCYTPIKKMYKHLKGFFFPSLEKKEGTDSLKPFQKIIDILEINS